jgi:hypothetical protein
MKSKTEQKILKGYLELLDKPDANEGKYRWITRAFFAVGFVFLFYYLSDNVDEADKSHLIVMIAFVSGLFFGLGIWMSQMSSQTKVFMQHMSRESVKKRIEEINS